MALKPQETGLPGPPPPAHLKTDRTIMVGVKGIEEKSGICAGVCRVSVDKLDFHTGKDFLPPNPPLSFGIPSPSRTLSPTQPRDGQLLPLRPCPLTSLRKELRVNLLEVLLIDNSAGTFLGGVGELKTRLKAETNPLSTHHHLLYPRDSQRRKIFLSPGNSPSSSFKKGKTSQHTEF